MMRTSSILVSALLIGCGAGAASEPEPSTPPASEPGTPSTRAHANPPADRLGTLPDGVGVAVGERAPEVSAVDAFETTEVALADLWSAGDVLVVFYRGGWCPFCNHQLHTLTEAYEEFQRRGVTLVAISVDEPESGARTRASWEIPFPVLSDPDLVAHRAFRVLEPLDDAMVERLLGHGMDVEASSGRTHHTIAVPALFLVDQEGVVRWSHADRDYRTRPSPQQIIEAIDALAR